jgi:hypothetical protein
MPSLFLSLSLSIYFQIFLSFDYLFIYLFITFCSGGAELPCSWKNACDKSEPSHIELWWWWWWTVMTTNGNNPAAGGCMDDQETGFEKKKVDTYIKRICWVSILHTR